MNAVVVRELPREEWHRVSHLDVGRFVTMVPSAEIAVFVMEDGDRIVGTWSALRMSHLEGAWIDPSYRRHAHAVAELQAATVSRASTWGRYALTGSNSPAVAHIIEVHLGGQPVAMDTYLVDLEAQRTPCR